MKETYDFERDFVEYKEDAKSSWLDENEGRLTMEWFNIPGNAQNYTCWCTMAGVVDESDPDEMQNYLDQCKEYQEFLNNAWDEEKFDLGGQ